ncbi:MAG: hypothetical protein ACLFU8_03795 [Anaerolineales bacterium]
MEEREPLGRRLGRFVTLLGMTFVVVMSVVVSRRLSDDALALLVGLGCGIAVLLPVLFLFVFVWREQQRRQGERREQRAEARSSPPSVVVVAPPMLPPGYGHQTQALPWQGESAPWPARRERKFTIVGEEDDE